MTLNLVRLSRLLQWFKRLFNYLNLSSYCYQSILKTVKGPHLDIGEDDHGQDNNEGHGPQGGAHHLGHAGVSPLGAADRVDHGQVAVKGHDRQAEDGGELVHGVRHHDNATQERAKGPVREHVLRGEEGQTHDVELVGHGQVEDVDVGDGLHLGVTQHHVDGERVARQTHCEDHEVDDRGHQGAAALEGHALSGQVKGDLRETRTEEQIGRRGGVQHQWRRGGPALVRHLHPASERDRTTVLTSECVLGNGFGLFLD